VGDTTGAGDSFHGGFLFGLSKERSSYICKCCCSIKLYKDRWAGGTSNISRGYNFGNA